MSMLQKLTEIGSFDGATNDWEKMQKEVNDFIAPALQIYFETRGENPFEEWEK